MLHWLLHRKALSGFQSGMQLSLHTDSPFRTCNSSKILPTFSSPHSVPPSFSPPFFLLILQLAGEKEGRNISFRVTWWGCTCTQSSSVSTHTQTESQRGHPVSNSAAFPYFFKARSLLEPAASASFSFSCLGWKPANLRILLS